MQQNFWHIRIPIVLYKKSQLFLPVHLPADVFRSDYSLTSFTNKGLRSSILLEVELVSWFDDEFEVLILSLNRDSPSGETQSDFGVDWKPFLMSSLGIQHCLLMTKSLKRIRTHIRHSSHKFVVMGAARWGHPFSCLINYCLIPTR